MGLFRFFNDPLVGAFVIVSLLIAITVHEFLHAWTANYLGDPTPKKMGRISLNPLAHLDPLGTVALLLIGIGWGKPVPINPNNFKNPRLGSALTAVAGPMSNLLLAMISSIIYRFGHFALPISEFLLTIIYFNLLLMTFNLFPIPPLDGSKFFALFFKPLDNPKLEQYGPFILIVFLLFGGFAIIGPIIIFLMKALGLNPISFAFLSV
jgi:Zn-dependent protease